MVNGKLEVNNKEIGNINTKQSGIIFYIQLPVHVYMVYLSMILLLT